MTTIAIPVGSTQFHFIVSESNGYQSREEVVVRTGAGILPGGTVMGRLTSTGQWEAWVTGGTYSALGLLADDVNATSAAIKRTMFIRGFEAKRFALTFSGSPTTAQKDAAFALLASQSVMMR